MFQGTRGNWNGGTIHIDLLPNTKPFKSKPYKIPIVYQDLVKEEIERLVEIGLLRKTKLSDWGAPFFVIPKKVTRSGL